MNVFPFLSHFSDHHTTTLYSYRQFLQEIQAIFQTTAHMLHRRCYFPSNKLGTLVTTLILLVMESCAYHSNLWPKLPEKKRHACPSNRTFATGSSLGICIISFLIVRDAGHILLHQFYVLKDTKWGCEAAEPRTKVDFHGSAFSHVPLTIVLEWRCVFRDSPKLYVRNAKWFRYHWG